MFLGEYQHSLDAKGRVILPARFRDELREGAVVTKGKDGCLCVYPYVEFQDVAERIQEAQRRGARELQAARSFFAGAAPATPDKQGRVAIPQPLREYAGLERDVTVVGQFTRLEIWDSQRWRQLDRAGDEVLAAGTDIVDFGL
jgi:MraZ protein